jgi:hypothetical protein
MTTALVGLGGVIVGSVLTALLNFYLQRAADRRRWEREDELRRRHWEREDRLGLRAERISLYRDYVEQVDNAMDGLGFSAGEMRLMMYQIDLLGSEEVSSLGRSLYFKAMAFGRELDKPSELESKLDEALEALESSLYEFNKAVRAELGIPDPPPHPPTPIEDKDE